MKPSATTGIKRSISSANLINPAPRCPPGAAAVVLAAVAALSLSAVLPAGLAKWAAAALLVLTPLAILSKAPHAVHMTIFALLWVLPADILPAMDFWPFDKLVPLALYGLLASAVTPLRRSIGWLRPGRFGPETRRPAAVIALLSGAALIGWVLLLKPDLHRYRQWMPPMPLWALPFAAAAFASVNAAMEEIIFRGIMLEALDSALGAGVRSIGAQAVAFAACHYLAGFPNGITGFMMVLVYGGMLGALRRRSRGLLAPWAAHVAADLVIFIVLAPMLLQHPRSQMA